jgi:outer membrane protein assembly factor BamB
MGYSSPIVTDQVIYITGDVDDKLMVFAFNLDGSLIWKISNGKAWGKPWPGARSACTFYDARLYHENAHGRVVSLNPQTGEELWAVDILERFDGENIRWALSECLLVDDGKVYVTPGGKKAFMAALDAETGQTVWQSPPLQFTRTHVNGGNKDLDEPITDFDKAGYASPILFRMGDRKIIARTSGQHAVCIDAETGEILWKHKIYARFEVIGAIPVLANDSILFAAPDDFGSTMFKLDMENNNLTVNKMWHTPMDNCHSSMVYVDGFLYGSGYRKLTDWACITSTGEIKYSKADLVKGSCVFADGRLYALAEDGNVELLRPTDSSFETVGSIKLAEGKRKDVWAHPVICNGRLYLRDHDNLWCYSIKKDPKTNHPDQPGNRMIRPPAPVQEKN